MTTTIETSLSITILAAEVLMFGLTLVWVVVRLVVGGALAFLSPRLVSTEVRRGRAGGVSETTARMFVILRTIRLMGGLFLEGGRLLLLAA